MQAGSLFVRKRREEEEDADDEPDQKKLRKSDAGTYQKNQCEAPTVRATGAATEVSASDGASGGACHCQWHLLPGKVSDMGKSSSQPSISAEGFLTESESRPETAACSMDFEGIVPENYQNDKLKLFLTESASAKLTEVFKLESDLRETTVREANDMCTTCLKDGSKEPNCVLDPISTMETQSIETEKMPELYYYM